MTQTGNESNTVGAPGSTSSREKIHVGKLLRGVQQLDTIHFCDPQCKSLPGCDNWCCWHRGKERCFFKTEEECTNYCVT